MKRKSINVVFYSLIVVITAQLNMNLFITDFKISIACICFPAFLFLIDSFPIIPVTLCSAIGVFTTRVLFYWFDTGTFHTVFSSFVPELSFYIVYGVLLYLYTSLYKGKVMRTQYHILPFLFIDYISNLSELLLRLQLGAFTTKTQTGILLVALLRALVIWCILTVFAQYRFLLLKKEHEDRYKRLVLLISKLNGEIIWMKKNTALIESTMNTSYKLYEKLSTDHAEPVLSKCALNIARDIHEIKKEYLLIMRGLSGVLDQEFQSEGMYLTEILALLKDSCQLLARENNRTLALNITCPYALYTDKHYFLLSIFRNLFINAIEASADDTVYIEISQQLKDNDYIFKITDHGPGILPENQAEVLKPGFSTKINYDTGEVNRGLGLNLVQDLVENQLAGNLTLFSFPGNTTFTLTIPKKSIEVLL